MTISEEFEGWKRVAYQPEVHAGVAGGFDDKWKKWPVRIGDELVWQQAAMPGKDWVYFESSAGAVLMWIDSLGGALCAVSTPGAEVEYVSATVPAGVLAHPELDWRVIAPGDNPVQALLDVLKIAGSCPVAVGSEWVVIGDIVIDGKTVFIKEAGGRFSLMIDALGGWRHAGLSVAVPKRLIKFVVAGDVVGPKDALAEIDRVLVDLDGLQRMLG